MSWAARRETTRVEDIAYCLMEIFGVNMPTLYGEGRRAFIRLQYEILKSSDDHSLFAWTFANRIDDLERGCQVWTNPEDDTFLEQAFSEDKRQIESGLLASSPRQFQFAQGVRQLEMARSKYPFSMTNNGLHIWLPVVEVRIADQEIYQAILSCEMLDGIGPLSIYLKRNLSGQYSRILTKIVCTATNGEYDPEPVELYVKEAYPEDSTPGSSSSYNLDPSKFTFHLVENPSAEQGYTLLDCGPINCWDQKTHSLRLNVPFSPCTSIVLSYIFVRANNNPTAQAMVILGVKVSSFKAKSRFFCAIYLEESEIDAALVRLRQGDGDYFDKTNSDVNLDQFTKYLPSGYIFSIAFRPGPTPNISTHNFRAMMMFTPSSLSFPSLVIPRTVNHYPAASLPKLNIHIDAKSLIVSFFYPEQNWFKGRKLFYQQKLLWTPTERHQSALLGFSSIVSEKDNSSLFSLNERLLLVSLGSSTWPSEKLKSPLLIFHVVDSDFAVELVNAPLDLQQSDWDAALPSYLDENNPTEKATRRRYQFPSDFPVEIATDTGTMRIELRRRMLLGDVGHQMLVTFKEKPSF